MWHNISAEETMKKLGSGLNGLGIKDARDRMTEYGPNTLDAEKKENILKKFIGQFSDYMIIILLAAAAISFAVSLLEGNVDFFDPVMILVIVMTNAFIGVYQENKAEKALDALKQLSAPHTNVIRGGIKSKIPAQDLVPGDIFDFETGDMIPADARLISSVHLACDESALTGESGSVKKSADMVFDEDTPVGDLKNMVWSGTVVTSGRGRAIVTETGMNTQTGKIADLLIHGKTPPTPLQVKLAHTGKVLGKSALLICLIMFIIGILRKIPPFEMFMTSVSLAVAAIPEGLPAIVTIMLSLGVQRMAHKNAIIRKLPAVETLGGATVICTDKTGTLTQNKMTVTQVTGDRSFVLELAAICSNNSGSTERAIMRAVDTVPCYTRVREIPFDSTRKMMTVVHKTDSGYRIISKGAVDVLLEKCLISPQKKTEILSANSDMAKNALRVIAVAYRDCTYLPENPETGMTFAGLIGMIDPPRPEAAEAVQTCRRAGIRPVMITGDHIETAMAIAKKTGIMRSGDKAICGGDLNKIDDEFLKNTISEYSVFARVTPEHKMRIVKALQNRGEIVAMTGDGVNDAPALKCADIGCAMGMTGTEVAKNAADMILTDDNFATIVSAVREGRGIYDNIRKAVHFLLSSNIGEIITIFTAILLGMQSPLAAIQLLWVNLVTDSFPAIALGMEKPDETVMLRKSSRSRGGLFSDGLGFTIITEGIMIGVLALLAFTIGSNIFGDFTVARTMCFTVLSLSQLVHAYNVRSGKSILKQDKNIFMNLSFLICASLQILVVSLPPLASIFKAIPLSFIQWIIVALLSLIPLITLELEKRLTKNI